MRTIFSRARVDVLSNTSRTWKTCACNTTRIVSRITRTFNF